MFLAIGGLQGVVAEVEVPAGKFGNFAGWVALGIFQPAQDAADAGNQLAWFKGFQDVIVGAQFQPHDAVADVGAAGQDDDAASRLGAYPLHDFKAVHVGQAEVDDA